MHASTTQQAQKFSVIPSGKGIGAEIVGIDLSKELDQSTFDAVRHAFFQHGVVVFRNQRMTAEQQIAFSHRFGELERNTVVSQFQHKQHPELLLVSNIKDENGNYIGAYDAGRLWHSDLAYEPRPSLCSLLYALEIPTDANGKSLGDTIFSSTSRAYDALPEATKQRIAHLRALNDVKARFGKPTEDGKAPMYVPEQRKEVSRGVHPVVRTHPVTGRKGLFVNEAHTRWIVDIPADESEQLLRVMFEEIKRPEFHYRHSWRVGDALMWDNCAVQHLATFDYQPSQRRLMQRTTVRGDVPV